MIRRTWLNVWRLTAALCLSALGPGVAAPARAAAVCAALPTRAGTVVNVSTTTQLQNAVANVTSDTTILIADGIYDLTNTLNIRGADRVTLRGASGNRDAVVLRGRGMSNTGYANVPHVIAIYDADDVAIADLTLRDAYYHLVQVHGEEGPQRPVFHNLHLIDAGEQFLKGSTGGAPGPYSDGGVVECSTFEYTNRARSDYTNGVDVLAGDGWIIRDSVFKNIRAPQGQLAGPAVLMWRNSRNTIVERNLFIECDRAIALGLSVPDANARDGEMTYDHQGGVIRNNIIYRAGDGDVGITVNYAANYRIVHNTIVLNGTFPWTIEYRFSVSSGSVSYNLTDGPIVGRDGATGTLLGNLTGAQTSWFVDKAHGDLHLAANAPAIGQAATLADVTNDFDGEARPIGAAPDVGADEYGVPAPAAVTNLRVTTATASGGTLTATLTWTPPAGATAILIKSASAPLTEANWESGSLPYVEASGGTTSLTLNVPYSGGTAFFALKARNADGLWSALSNNAVWPRLDLFLPAIRH